MFVRRCMSVAAATAFALLAFAPIAWAGQRTMSEIGDATPSRVLLGLMGVAFAAALARVRVS